MLLKLLNTRYTIAKAFTKDFHSDAKQAIDDYEAKSSDQKKDGIYNKHVKAGRYDITIPYIFATHESLMASFFEKMPEIITTGRSTRGTTAANILKALYSYLEDKCDLDEFLALSSWWFFLIGMVSSHQEYKVEQDGEAPQLDSNGEPLVDEMGEPIMMPTYSYHDPVVSVDNMLKVYFAPDSEFSIDGKKVPYYITEKLVEVDEIEEVYGVEVEADEELEVGNFDTKQEEVSDLKRAKVMYYSGRLPKTEAQELLEMHELEWRFGQDFKIYFTKSKILLVEEADKQCKLARFYAAPSSFFGYGLGKTLKPFQDDMSVRRSQMLRYADMYAYPWLLLNGETKVDQKAIEDYRKKKPMTYSGDKPPEYLTPPDMPAIVTQADEAMRSDAQFVSGTLDLSKGAQETNTVKTATGQQLFAQSQDKRLQKARKAIAKYYREVVISLFKLCRDNWEDHKVVTYTNDEGEEMELEILKEDLQGIDFDTDVDFNLDTVSVNQDIMSQRWISLLEQSAELPFANNEKIYQKVLKESYKINNPEGYVLSPEEQMANQPQVDAAGNPLPVTNPETVPQPESMGAELAPEVPYAG